MKFVTMAALLGAGSMCRLGNAQAKPTGAVTGEISVREKGFFGWKNRSDKSGVVVWIEGVPGAEAPAKTVGAAVRQRDKTFVPRVVAVTKGSSVEFPNDDKIFHNVFSLSQNSKFDLGLYKSGSSRTVVFDKPGIVDVYCNIHPDMVATIRVLDTSYFAVTDKKGRFRIEVPPGDYPVMAWAPGSDEVRGRATVAAGGTAEVRLEVVVGAGAAQHHLRKDGTPYGRYQ